MERKFQPSAAALKNSRAVKKSASMAARPATAAPAQKVKPQIPASRASTLRPATAAAPAKRTIASMAAGPATEVTVKENLSNVNDPIALAMQARLKVNSLNDAIKEAEAKKLGIPISKLSKHVVKPGPTNINLLL